MRRKASLWCARLAGLALLLIPALAFADGPSQGMGHPPPDAREGLVSFVAYPKVLALSLGALQIVIIAVAILVAVFPPRAPRADGIPPDKG